MIGAARRIALTGSLSLAARQMLAWRRGQHPYRPGNQRGISRLAVGPAWVSVLALTWSKVEGGRSCTRFVHACSSRCSGRWCCWSRQCPPGPRRHRRSPATGPSTKALGPSPTTPPRVGTRSRCRTAHPGGRASSDRQRSRCRALASTPRPRARLSTRRTASRFRHGSTCRTPNGYQTFVSQDGSQVSGFYLQLRGDSNRFAFTRIAYDSPAGLGTIASAPSIIPQPGEWYHLTGVYDSVKQTISLYVNGALQQTQSFVPNWQASGPFAVGRGIFNGNRRTSSPAGSTTSGSTAASSAPRRSRSSPAPESSRSTPRRRARRSTQRSSARSSRRSTTRATAACTRS